jgi:endonuclease YncB( thermonuclease family)
MSRPTAFAAAAMLAVASASAQIGAVTVVDGDTVKVGLATHGLRLPGDLLRPL